MWSFLESIIVFGFFGLMLMAWFINTWSYGKLGKIALALYGFELCLAWALSTPDAAKYTHLLSFAGFIGQYADTVTNFDGIARYKEGVQIYLAITLCLIPAKIILLLKWLARDKLGNYRHSVISPLSRKKNIGHLDFIKDAATPEERSDSTEQKSMTYIVFFSLALWFLTLGFVLVFALDYGSDVHKGGHLRSVETAYTSMTLGGFWMWYSWSLLRTTFLAFFIAVSLCTFRDWCIYLNRLFSFNEKEELSENLSDNKQ